MKFFSHWVAKTHRWLGALRKGEDGQASEIKGVWWHSWFLGVSFRKRREAGNAEGAEAVGCSHSLSAFGGGWSSCYLGKEILLPLL